MKINSKKYQGPRPHMAANLISKKVSNMDNEMLIQPFIEIEVKEAIWGCDSSKSPGPDGFNFRFMKEFWDVIKWDLLGMLEEFNRNGKLVRGFFPLLLF